MVKMKFSLILLHLSYQCVQKLYNPLVNIIMDDNDIVERNAWHYFAYYAWVGDNGVSISWDTLSRTSSTKNLRVSCILIS